MRNEKTLDYLRSGSWISGEEMAQQLGISRAAVWKQIKNLRSRGYRIESSTNRGYRLTYSPDILDASKICSELKTKFIGRNLHCYQEVKSTNEVARSIARSCDDGTVVLAEIQTAGRGRMARAWASPYGGIWMSLILKPKIALANAYKINMAVSVALSRAVASLYGLKASIKWPNDLLINDRKVCGILMEISAEIDRLEYAVIGIGINANVDAEAFPDEWKATSISRELGSEISRIELIQRVLQEIEDAYCKMDSQEIYQEWCDRSATLGRCVRINSAAGDFDGEAISLSEDGALLVKASGNLLRVVAGDCIHLRDLRGRETA